MAEAKGFCTCKRDAPDRPHLHPPANATWHFLCDKPVLPPRPDADHSSDGSFRYPARTTPGPVPDWSREDQAAEDARHAGEQWPPGNGFPRNADTDRCEDCGHLAERECDCHCCGLGKIVAHITSCPVCWPVFAALGRVFDGAGAKEAGRD